MRGRVRATHPGTWGHSTAWASLLEDNLREEAWPCASCLLVPTVLGPRAWSALSPSPGPEWTLGDSCLAPLPAAG